MSRVLFFSMMCLGVACFYASSTLWILAVSVLLFCLAQWGVNAIGLSRSIDGRCSFSGLMIVYVVKHVVSYLTMALIFYWFPGRWDLVLLGLIAAIVIHSRILAGCNSLSLAYREDTVL